MVFENNDDFGIDLYREDVFNSVINKNLVEVLLIKFNKVKGEDIQGDFLGVQSNKTLNTRQKIRININSYSPFNTKLKMDGFNARGELKFNCYASYDTQIDNKDIIRFTEDYSFGIKSGDTFKVEMGDCGMYQGQFCFKQFTIIKTSNNYHE